MSDPNNYSYRIITDLEQHIPEETMGHKWNKFLLLMWKNWLLQYRKPIQTIVEIVAPVLFSIILVVIRSLVTPETHPVTVYNPFCTIPIAIPGLCVTQNATSVASNSTIYSKFTLVYSPDSEALNRTMTYFEMVFGQVIALNDSQALERYLVTNENNFTFAGIQFDDSYYGRDTISKNQLLKVSLRFPGELRFSTDIFGQNNWKTNLLYPIFQTAGPRSPDSNNGASPSYYSEGFLTLQHLVTLFTIFEYRNVTIPTLNDTLALISFIKDLEAMEMPLITMRRFPYASWQEDMMLTALKSMVSIIIMLSFNYTCINTVKAITTEKEKQLKEAMKIMGMSSWLHWTAWFCKTFLFLLISIILMTVLLTIKWYKHTDYTVFTYADPTVLLLFLFFYICSIITFCFAVSVFFSKANTAATIAGLAWFLAYAPYLFLQESYDTLSLGTKLGASVGFNTAMAFGMQIMLMFEGTGEGIQWDNIFKTNTPDDNLTLGACIIMLGVDTILYLLVALYVEAIFPGEYGVPRPWYFPFTSTFWCGQPRNTGVEDFNDVNANNGEFFEVEPENFETGIKIINLRKVFKKKPAVRNLNLNIYENQITVLLGHNGAGKSTTMSMLTGMFPPTSGTAVVGGYDIRTNIEAVRNSLGLCPQHNIIFDELTVAEHLYFFSKLKGVPKSQIQEEIESYVDLLELQEKKHTKANNLSGGMKRKLCVAIALCGKSKVVMLDEPTAGMDPAARRALWDLLLNQKKGRTMLLTTHFMDEADILGDRIAIMAGGELQCCGSSFFLKKKYSVGYHLVIDISQSCDPYLITQLLRRHITDIEIYSNIGSELTYLLAENQSYIFESMLRDLEENSERLGVNSYGVSLTTLEEVFMKVGADHGQEEQYDDLMKNGQNSNNNKLDEDTIEAKVDIRTTASLSKMEFLKNQFLAMIMKKSLSTWRSWQLLAIQIFMPVIFLIIAVVVSRNRNTTGNLPSMPLTLSKYDAPVTLLEDNQTVSNYSDIYKRIVSANSQLRIDSNITATMINLTAVMPTTVRRHYIIGASFESITLNPFPLLTLSFPHINAWFNNDPYHSPGLALSLVLDTTYRKLMNCSSDNCGISFINAPLPYSAATQVNQLSIGNSMGFQLAFNIAFSMAFVASFYIVFVVKERVSKSKHLQFVSGVGVFIFWITTYLCDLLTYVLTVIALLITLVLFQEDGFKTVQDIGRLFLILFYFGFCMLPMMYLAGYLFSVPSTGYTRMTLFNIFTGVAAFLIVQILGTEGLGLEQVGKVLHWVFLVLPHYSLASGIRDNFTLFSYKKMCNYFFEVCMEANKTATNEDCLNLNPTLKPYCEDLEESYFKWDSPGIGRNVLFSFVVGLAFFIIILMGEYKIFSKIIFNMQQMIFPKVLPKDEPDEDSDVVAEKEKIRDTPEYELLTNYTLVLKNLTKYYKKFLAVKSLCLGVRKYECFGLLGINGAGKTTTFKMMTGDVRISHGDGWVNGYSIKNNVKQAQKFIGYCPQFDALLDDLTARETITIFSLLRGIRLRDCDTVARKLAKDFDFSRHLEKKVKELSGGNKRKLSTSLSLIGDPPVIYLDEPSTGMDPATKRFLWNSLCKIRDSGKCIILTSHAMEECEALCTRLAVMVNGRFKCLGSTQHLKNKFAEGYTLTIKVKKHLIDGIYELETTPVENFVQEHFPGSTLREKHQDLLSYYITDRSMRWSKMFGILERGKRGDLNIEDYSLGQSSLEQVFLTFAKQQISVD